MADFELIFNVPVLIKRSSVLPRAFVRQLDAAETKEFEEWAKDPNNQTLENLQNAAIVHPTVRNVWVELGLVRIIEHL